MLWRMAAKATFEFLVREADPTNYDNIMNKSVDIFRSALPQCNRIGAA
jgi:hypothetical protein